ncbi:ATAD3B [Symbiodinium sp. CCMP2592]|nr:ATAD3B [Symbiodinium sp. CCMP2592]
METQDCQEASNSPETTAEVAVSGSAKGKGKSKGPPLPTFTKKPEVAKQPEPKAISVDLAPPFQLERPPNSEKGGVIKFTTSSGSQLPFLVRQLTDSGRGEKGVRVDQAVRYLGRLRALRFECDNYNAATRPADAQRFLEFCSSCGVQAGERPVDLPGLDELIQTVEGEIEDLESLREEIGSGHVQFTALAEVFIPGKKVFMQVEGLSEPVGMTVLQSWYQQQQTLFGPEKSFHMELEFLAYLGSSFALVNFQEVMSAYKGVRRLDSLFYIAMTSQVLEKLHQRGKKYRDAAMSSPYVQYSRGSFFAHGRAKHATLSGGRVMLDTQRGHEYGHHAARGGDNCSLALQQALRTFKLQQKHGTETLRLVQDPQDSELWMAWPAMVGFSFTAKCWGQVLVADTSPIQFRADAFQQLVLPDDTKEIIRSAVRHAGTSGLDFIEGKGDNTIFLLYGPPGCGKTLTAEAIAEMLHMPLYVVTAGDLGINAQEVEQNLSQVLHLCSEWNALTLIDEADIFLEARSSSELQRNALVCVMLRLLEYHQGILFLTSNRASNIDPAVRSRITVALHYEPLSQKGREAVWRNLLQKLPHSQADPSKLSRHVLNGRQIKSCLLLGNALAAERGEELSGALIERAVVVVADRTGEGVLQTTTVAAMPRGRTILQQDASGSTIVTPRVSRERPLQPKDSSSPLLPGSTGLPSSILVPASPRLISTSTSTSLASVATRGPSIGLRSKPSQSQSLWEPTQSQRQQRASSHLVLGHDANPFQQNGPASSGIPPDATTFTDAAPQLHS